MKTNYKVLIRLGWLLVAQAAVLGPAARGQGSTIVYVHLPPNNPNQSSYDSRGTRVGPDLPILINGQTVATLTAGDIATGQFTIQPSSLAGVIGVQPFVYFPDDIFVAPLPEGTEIGPGAAGYGWFDGSYDHPLLAAYRPSFMIEEPWLCSGYFAGVESAYLGFNFQEAGQTYYGWMRAGSPVIGLNIGWVYDYAYQTVPNTPILAGVGVVPEPSALSLCVLGAAAAPLLRRRKPSPNPFQ